MFRREPRGGEQIRERFSRSRACFHEQVMTLPDGGRAGPGHFQLLGTLLKAIQFFRQRPPATQVFFDVGRAGFYAKIFICNHVMRGAKTAVYVEVERVERQGVL